MRKIKSGVVGLDSLFDGGINENSTTVNSQADGGLAEIFSNREFCSVLPIIVVVIILAIIIIIIKKRGSFFGLKPGGEGGY